MQMLSRLRARFGIEFSLRDIFEYTRRLRLSPRALSIEKRFSSLTLCQPAANAFALSKSSVPQFPSAGAHPQNERELPGLPQFNLPGSWGLQGPLNVSALERSFVGIVHQREPLHCVRHSLGRTSFLLL